MPKVIIEVEFDRVKDEFDEDYEYLEKKSVTVRGEDVTPEEMSGLAEVWAQSDWFYVDFTADVINGLDDN